MAPSPASAPRLLACVMCCVLLLGMATAQSRAGQLLLSSGTGSLAQRLANETQLWRQTLDDVLHQASGVTWSLRWDDLGYTGDGPPETNFNSGQEARLLDCVNGKSDNRQGESPMSWEALLEREEVGTMHAVGAWWSNPDPITAPTTMVTAATVSRVPQLYAQCKKWNGPLSAVLFQPLLVGPTPGLSAENQALLRAAVLVVSQFVADMQLAPNACKPDVLVVWQMYTDERSKKLLYPVNILRNLARLQARTPMVALVDVDLVLSWSLAERFVNNTIVETQQIMKAINSRALFVIPAFDVRDGVEQKAWADALASADKHTMVNSMAMGLVYQFHLNYPSGHNSTDYTRWAEATADYQVECGKGYEPWFVGSRLLLPWHDARYMGYGLNKVQFIQNLKAENFTFTVLHDAFAIHRAHETAPALIAFKESKNAHIAARESKNSRDVGQAPNLYTFNTKLYARQRDFHKKGKPFNAYLSPATRDCVSSLPWWNGARGGSRRP